MIVLFTDFGVEGPYIGQMKAVLAREAPSEVVIDLFANAPSFDAQSAAYLLAAYSAEFSVGTVFLAVVDPGVGSERRAAAVLVDGRWFVGPDNGLFNVVAMRARDVQWWDLTWRPEHLSASFHGRDLFAPVAARLSATTSSSPALPARVRGRSARGWDWIEFRPTELHRHAIDRATAWLASAWRRAAFMLVGAPAVRWPLRREPEIEG